MLSIGIGLLVGLGLYWLMAGLFRLPSHRAVAAVNGLVRRKNKTSRLTRGLDALVQRLARHIRLNDYKRQQLAADLRTAGLTVTPEVYRAKAIVKAALCGVLAVPVYALFPLMTPVVIALAVMLYLRESRSIQDAIQARRAAIEYELPRLVFTIHKTLQHDRDMLTLLERYRRDAGPALRDELEMTVADMVSGHPESALTRLEARVGSPMLSDVVRGLLSVLRGDDTAVYWEALSVKFADIQRQQLRQQAARVPGKVHRLSMVLLVCFVAVYAVVLAVQILTSLNVMFG